MKKLFEIFILLLVAVSFSFGQMTFQKSFTNSNFDDNNHFDEEGYSAIQTIDGGYILVGLTRDINNNADVIITKLNSIGNVVWEKIYGSPEYDKGYGVAELKSGGYVVVAKTNAIDDDGDWWILRTDENGDTLWTKRRGDTGVDIPYKVMALENGGFVVAGQVWGFYSSTIKNDDGLILCLDDDGNEIWQHIVTNSIKDPLRGITQTSDGGFVVCGNAWNEVDGIYDTYTYKIDAAGELKWTHTYKYTNPDEEYNNQRVNAIAELTNGELVMVGKKVRSATENIWNLMFKRLSSTGELLRDTYDYEVGDEEATEVLVRDDGNLILVGNTESHVLGGATSSIFISIYDTAGTHISRSLLGANNSGHNWAYSVSKTSDNGLVVGGYATLWQPVGTSGTGYYYKTRFIGKTDCNGSYENLNISDKAIDFGDVEYGQTVLDTIVFKNNWLYDIHLSSTLQYHYPEVFTIHEGNLDDDTLTINSDDSLIIVVAYTPKSESEGVKDSTVLYVSWDKVYYDLNYTNNIDLLGLGNEPVGIAEEENIPAKFELSQNYPNPFNPSTVIRYSLPVRQAGIPGPGGQTADDAQHVTLKIYDTLGNEVATIVNENQPAGNYEITFNGTGLASGMYIYKLTAGNFTSVKKMLFLK